MRRRKIGINLLRILVDATTLDAFDLTFEFSSEALKTLSVLPFSRLKTGILPRAAIFLWHLCQSLAQPGSKAKTDIPTGVVIFFVMSKNEADSLEPVQSKMRGAYMADSREGLHPFHFFLAYALSCPYLPLVVLNYCKSEGYRRKSFSYVFDHHLLIYGLYITNRLWLNRLKPKALVLANHLYTYHRVLQKAAYDENITTFYLQHASLPEQPSPLATDYALLDGLDALSKLAPTGARGPRTFLIGMPKQDAHIQHINVQAQVRSIGICVSSMDPVPRVEQMLAQIRNEFPAMPLVLRPKLQDHGVHEWKDLARRYDMVFSDLRTEFSFDFLKHVDAVIAGESNILLEAALMDVTPIYYDFAQNAIDWYGFLRNGLVEYLSDPDEICRYITSITQTKPPVRMKAKRYCETVGTRYDGHSCELAAALIQTLTSSSQVDSSIWKRIPDIGVEAYGLDHSDESMTIVGNP